MKSRALFKTVLSGVAGLGLFAVQEAGAATDAYLVRPQANTHNNSYNYVSQSFVAVCDSVTKIAFFLGQKSGSSNYQMEIDSAGTAKGGVLSLSYAGAKAYADNEGTYGTPVPVKRGYTYTLKFSRQSAMETVDFYYVGDTTAYLWGKIIDPGTVTGDLCAQVVGRNRIPVDYWGVNGSIYTWDGSHYPDSTYIAMQRMGITLDRAQIPWYWLQCDTCNPNSYQWGATDTAIKYTNRYGRKLMFNVGWTPKWASSRDTTLVPESLAYQSPPINLDSAFNNGNGKNYLYNLMRKMAERYGPGSGYNPPVRDWEIYNEVNAMGGWNYWDYRYYNSTTYPHNTEGRAKLYVKACSVAYRAIKDVDSGARIYTNALAGVNGPVNFICAGDTGVRGRVWLREFYNWHGERYTDVITYHFYQPWNVTPHQFSPSYFRGDYDTLRAILWEKGDGYREVWADEGGWSTAQNGQSGQGIKVDSFKQADIAVQTNCVGLDQLVNGRGPLNHVSWYLLYDQFDPNISGQDTLWELTCGLTKTVWGTSYPPGAFKPSAYAYKQITGKLKDKYFNRQVPVGNPSDSVYCYEFQIPGSDTCRKTWVVWRSGPWGPPIPESLAIRTNRMDSVQIAYDNAPPSGFRYIDTTLEKSGKFHIAVDTVPRYIFENESQSLSRPDVVVDSVWIYPSNPDPRAGEGVWFYARLRNIGNDSLRATITNLVTFQVDGVSKKSYQASRGLAPLKTPRDPLDTLTVGAGSYSIPDWTATWGDHLIKAWADSADRYVELREDNNMGYLWKHFQPKVSVLINNNHEFTNHRSNDSLHVVFNGGTSPTPDSAKLKHEGNWTKTAPNPATRDTTVTYTSDGAKFDSIKVFQGGDTYTDGDSIVVDTNAPYADITSPVPNQKVSGTVPFWGNANDWYEHHLSYWEIRKDPTGPWCSGDTEIGRLNPVIIPGLFGNWNSTQWPNGYYWHWLTVNDSAGNTSRDSVRVKVQNNSTNGGSGWASGFGTFASPVMNVATDPSGNVYFAETQNSKIRKYSPRKDSLFAFSAKRGNDTSGVSWPSAMILKDTTLLWVADGLNDCIKQFNRQGNLVLRFGSHGRNSGEFREPRGIALDQKGRIWAVDGGNDRVQVFDSTGHFLFQFGSQGRDSGRFNSPTGITITPNGLVWVSDTRNNQLQVFDSLGHYLKTIKAVDSLGLDTPLGICSDKWGDIFIADSRRNRIVELNPFGERIFDFGGQGDSLWQFRTPVGVASSPGAHYLYVADAGNRRVQRFIVIEEDTTGGGPQGGAGVQVLPMVYELGPAIPNPSKGQTTFRYALPKESQVNFAIYNVAGQVVREINQGKQKAGYYSMTWDGRNNQGHKVGPGVYFYRLQAGSWAKTRKMVVIR